MTGWVAGPVLRASLVAVVLLLPSTWFSSSHNHSDIVEVFVLGTAVLFIGLEYFERRAAGIC